MSLKPKTVRWLRSACGMSLKGKTVLITGGNSGIGFKTAEIALFLGADVLLACRNPEKASAAREALLRDYPRASVGVLRLDLADFSSVDAFADELMEKKTDIHVFVNNAGAFRHPGEKTADGFDLVYGTNYIGVYRLSERILPYLAALPHEVYFVNTVSVIIRAVRKADPSAFRNPGREGSLSVYARSKLCLAKYSWALAMRYRDTGVRVLMSHPGIAVTPLGLNAFGHRLDRLAGIFGGIFNSPEQSALSLAYILSHDLPPGSLAGPSKFFGIRGYPKQNRVPRYVKDGAEELARATGRETGS